LVAAGLWSDAGDTFVFTSWHEYQPSKAQVEARRDATKNRVNTWREGKSNGVTETFTGAPRNAPPGPARPGPARKEAKASSGRTPETFLADDWQPSEACIKYARENRLNLSKEADAFRGHAATHERQVRNWDAAFRTWLGKATPGPAQPDPQKEWLYNR